MMTLNPSPATILVVDDDADVREVIAETLEGFGYSVIVAASGEEALPMLAERVTAGLKVIITSGYFLPQPIAERFLKKPFRMHELASAVRAELA